MDRATFGYSPGQTALQDVSLTIPAGAHVAVVGPSGCGKSTLFNLLLRFYDPSHGSVSIHGQDVRRIAQASWRGQIGTVFGQSLSVSPNEVLRLLDQGTRIIGSGRLIADDEVAVTYSPLDLAARCAMESGSTPKGPEQGEGQGTEHQPSPGLVELLGRAVTDEQFRDKLYTDQEDATRGYMLTDSDRNALNNLPRDELEQQAKRFGTSTATAISIGISIKGTF